MASELAERGYQIIFIEPLPKRWPRLNEFSRVWGRLTGDNIAAGLCEQPLIPGVNLLSPRLLPDTGNITRKLNRLLFIPAIAENVKENAERPLIVINYLPTAASISLMENLQPDVKIYHCINDWSNDPFTPAHEYEEKLAASVDMVWADSPINISRTSKMSPNVIPLPHGVDIELFTKARSTTKPAHTRPVCAYFGTIREGLDIDLLRKVSYRYPLRLIGPVRIKLEGFSKDTEIVGPVPQEQVPLLLRDVDVLLLPYAQSVFNESVMPAKLFECLATGKPAIVSGLGTVYDYAELFYIRENHDDFIDAIELCLQEPEWLANKRLACAEDHSYAQRSVKIEGYLKQILIRQKQD